MKFLFQESFTPVFNKVMTCPISFTESFVCKVVLTSSKGVCSKCYSLHKILVCVWPKGIGHVSGDVIITFSISILMRSWGHGR